MSVDYQVDSFMDLLAENFLRTSTNVFAESPWRNEYSFYLVDFQYSLIQISMLEFLESLEFIEF